MIKDKKILAIVLARGGSKRLPKKNIKSFNGKPMISWTIEAAKRSKYVDKVIVSTDSEEIASIARSAGAETPFIRPSELAADSTTSEDSLIHALNEVIKTGEKYDIMIDLQPTSPLRNNSHLDAAIEEFISHKKAKSLVSVMLMDKNPYWTQFVDSYGIMKPHFRRKNRSWVSSPDKALYMPNGAIYIMWVKDFLIDKKRYTDITIPYVMDKSVSADIDEEQDFAIAEFLMKYNKSNR